MSHRNQPRSRRDGPSFDQMMAVLAGPSPCDGCVLRIQCALREEACLAFLRFVNSGRVLSPYTINVSRTRMALGRTIDATRERFEQAWNA
jgi:hypothetical protein